MKAFLLLVIVAAFAVGCDPARRITMKNVGTDTTQIIWTASEDSIGFNPFVLHNSKELKFTIPPGKNNEVKLSFGVGSWTPDYVETFMKYLKSVEVISKQQSFKLDSTAVIKEYFLAHRKKNRTVVEVLMQ